MLVVNHQVSRPIDGQFTRSFCKLKIFMHTFPFTPPECHRVCAKETAILSVSFSTSHNTSLYHFLIIKLPKANSCVKKNTSRKNYYETLKITDDIKKV